MAIDAVILCGALLALYIFLILVLRARRRRSAVSAAPRPTQPAFGSAEIRAMLEAGQITREEYDRLLAAVIKQRKTADDDSASGVRGFEVLPAEPPGDQRRS